MKQVITARCEVVSNSKNITPIFVIFSQWSGLITRLLLVDRRGNNSFRREAQLHSTDGIYNFLPTKAYLNLQK
jgi:hypothetical protein